MFAVKLNWIYKRKDTQNVAESSSFVLRCIHKNKHIVLFSETYSLLFLPLNEQISARSVIAFCAGQRTRHGLDTKARQQRVGYCAQGNTVNFTSLHLTGWIQTPHNMFAVQPPNPHHFTLTGQSKKSPCSDGRTQNCICLTPWRAFPVLLRLWVSLSHVGTALQMFQEVKENWGKKKNTLHIDLLLLLLSKLSALIFDVQVPAKFNRLGVCWWLDL